MSAGTPTEPKGDGEVPSTTLLLGCVKQKRDVPSAAMDLYRSPLWVARRRYAEASGHPWLILSALHGVLDPDQVVEPYDLALSALPKAERRAWAVRVLGGLQERAGTLAGRTYEIHAGAVYRGAIEAELRNRGAVVTVPLAGLPLGRQLRWYRDHQGAPRRRHATEGDLEAALEALDTRPMRIPAKDWPGDLHGLIAPGLYSWWVDAPGAAELGDGLSESIAPGRIYAGLTGATKWPSGATGKATLRSRIGSNHLRGRIRGSTFRLTLASALVRPLNLHPVAPKMLTSDSETRLSMWIGEHLEVAVFPFENADALADLEDRVLQRLDPPLNLEGMPDTPVRASLRRLRSAVARGEV